MASQRPGRYLKSFLEAVRFILTKYGPVAIHGDPIHARNDLNFSNCYVSDHTMLCKSHVYFIFVAGTLGGWTHLKRFILKF